MSRQRIGNVLAVILLAAPATSCDKHSRSLLTDVPQARLAIARDLGLEFAMRDHAWEIVSSICTFRTPDKAEWQTWPTKRELLAAQEDDKNRWIANLARPAQTLDLGLALPKDTGSVTDNKMPSSEIMRHVIADVRFNPKAFSYIRKSRLWDIGTLAALPQGKRIVSFPRGSIAVKAVWWPVNGSGRTVLPVWDGIPPKPIHSGIGNRKDRFGNDFSNWEKLIAIDSGTDHATMSDVEVEFPDWGSIATPRERHRIRVPLVSLNRFHAYKLTCDDLALLSEPELAHLKEAFHFCHARDPQCGDWLALVALHIASKDLPDWSWATLWWHNSPNGYFDSRRPRDQAAPWRNYLMDVAFDANKPRERGGQPNTIFNPWLEAPLRNGVVSNCLSCHERAAFDSVPEASGNTDRMSDAELEDYLHGKIWLDYMWSLRQY